MPGTKHHQPPENDLHRLSLQISRTNRMLYRFVSFKQALLRGILTGLGGVLGATVVLALLLSLLARLEFVPIFGNFANQIIDFMKTNPR